MSMFTTLCPDCGKSDDWHISQYHRPMFCQCGGVLRVTGSDDDRGDEEENDDDSAAECD